MPNKNEVVVINGGRRGTSENVINMRLEKMRESDKL